ncbi:hypothetical protein Tco_0881894 [Tanacetum coccineum]
MQLIQKLRDDQKCMKKFEPSSRSKATEDIISIGSFVEVLVLNHYVLDRKYCWSTTVLSLTWMATLHKSKSNLGLVTQKKLSTMTADEYFVKHLDLKQKFDDELENEYWGY